MSKAQLLLWTLVVVALSVAGSWFYWKPHPPTSDTKSFIDVTPETLSRLRALQPKGPVQMVNLVKFQPEGGREAYREYTKLALPVLTEKGGRMVLVSKRQAVFTLLGDQDWDAVFIAEFPSIEAWLEMLETPQYQEALVHRKRAVLNFRLFCCLTPESGGTEVGF